MSEDAVLIAVDQNPPKAPAKEPLVAGDCKLHDPQHQEVKLPAEPAVPPISKPEPLPAAPPEAKPEPKRVLRPWYEMLDSRR